MSNTNRTGNLSIDSDNIFPIIKKWLYSDHDIFIRELVSNGCDAITKLKKLEIMGEYTFPEDYKASIQVIVNPEEKTMKFIDTGLGMTADEVEEYITKIAFSGATAFLEKYKDKTNADEMIGHFGLGFYSAFMVADEVHIDTLSYRDGATAVHWECDGGTQYTIGDGSKTTVGTEITLYLNEESVEFANEYRTREVLDKYCSFMPTEIYLSKANAEPEYETIDAADKLLERAADYENTEDLTAALTAAKAVYANTSATQTEVDRAASTLLDALAAMAERADLAALKKLVASAGGLEEKDFTSDSYKDLKDAMDAAKDVIDDLNRTPEAIGKAYADIITAITNLERVGNKAALVAVIAKAEAIVAAKDSYVSSTLNGLEEALAAGKAVNDNPDALQDAINNAVTLLTEKVANVRLLGDVNNDGSVTTDDSALLLRSAAELDTLDDAATVSADMNQDGIADTSDAVLILQTAAEF